MSANRGMPPPARAATWAGSAASTRSSWTEVIGPIPLEMQSPAVFSAGRLAASTRAAQSDALLKYFASPEVAPVLRESGLEP